MVIQVLDIELIMINLVLSYHWDVCIIIITDIDIAYLFRYLLQYTSVVQDLIYLAFISSTAFHKLWAPDHPATAPALNSWTFPGSTKIVFNWVTDKERQLPRTSLLENKY